ncbi:hypothetical protein COLO4_14879 [Corchorus olitorius]|uniref:F-box domain-containing protein n=1 Tax=Corchorus olitorius TaxID=93759 RepID=A0A1R3JQK6_9ROSI|nr:hypothetical protein COLO4_14879 [Corchorus olitorius]
MSDYLNLPQDLFAEILVRLPIQDVVKSTAVCKSWNSLIKTPTFISTHLQKSISSTKTNLLLFRLCTSTSTSTSTSPWFESGKTDARLEYSLRLDNKAVDEYKQLPCPNIGGCRFRVAGSYNGLVCLVEDGSYGYGDTFILWNPLIKKAIHLPEPNVTYSSHGPYDAFTGFGFDSKTDDYKLLRYLVLDDNSIEAEVYSLNANCWTSITPIAPKYIPHFEYPRNYGNSFVNGAIHLLAGNDQAGYRVLAFDVSEQVFSEIPLPDHLSNASFPRAQLLTYRQSSIATMTWEWEPSLIELWVMKEYGVATSWTKVFTEKREIVARVLFLRQDEQVFVTIKGGLISSIDIKSKHFEDFGVESVHSLEYFLVVDSYVESLVLLDKCCNAGLNVISIDEDDANSTDK